MPNDDHSDAKPPFMLAQENLQKEERKKACISFFENLPDADFNFADFQKNWNLIEKLDDGHIQLTPAELTTILTNSIIMLDRLEDQHDEQARELRKNCLSEMMFRFRCWEKPAEKKMSGFSQHQLAITLRNFRALSLNPSDKILGTWYSKANPRKIMRGGDHETRVVRSLVSLAVAQVKPSEGFKEEWYPKATRGMPYFRPSQLGYCFWAFARFAEEPPQEFLDEWQERFNYLSSKYASHFHQRDIANIIGGAGVMHAVTGKTIYKEIAEAAKPLISLEDCDLPQQRQLWLAHLWFDWDYDGKPPEMDDRPSNYENTIKDIFRKHGYETAQEGRKIRVLNHKPDDNFDINGRTIFCEIDGNKTHFLYEIAEFDGQMRPAGFTGRTLFMAALAKKFEPDAITIRLPFQTCTIFENAEDDQQQAGILSALMNDASKMRAGAYHARARRPGDETDSPLVIRPLKIAELDGQDASLA